MNGAESASLPDQDSHRVCVCGKGYGGWGGSSYKSRISEGGRARGASTKSTKSEARNPKQTASTKRKGSKRRYLSISYFCHSDLFRISCFGFRISRPEGAACRV